MSRKTATELERAYILLNEKNLTTDELAKMLKLSKGVVQKILDTKSNIISTKQEEQQIEVVEVVKKTNDKMRSFINHKTSTGRKISAMTPTGSEMLDDSIKSNKGRKITQDHIAKIYPNEE